MNLLVSILVTFLFLIVLPIVYGQLWKNVISDGNVIFACISGLFTLLALFELMGSTLILLSIKIDTQVVIESIVLILFACLVCITKRNRIGAELKKYNLKTFFKRAKLFCVSLTRYESIYLVVFFFLLFAQVYFATFFDIGEWRSDDYAYVVMSSSAIFDGKFYASEFTLGSFTNGIMPKYMFCGIYSFYTYASVITGLNPSVIEHTVCAVLFLLMAYGVFYLLSKLLFPREDDREKRLLFLIFLSLIFLFGLYSHYSISFRLFGVIWQGKAFLAVVSIPFLLAIYPRLLEGQYGYKQMLYCAMISLATISLTMMGVIAMVVIPGILTLLHMIRTKSLRCISLLIASEIIPAIMVVAYLLYT